MSLSIKEYTLNWYIFAHVLRMFFRVGILKTPLVASHVRNVIRSSLVRWTRWQPKRGAISNMLPLNT